MMKEYRVDSFVSGNHTKKYFDSLDDAERYGTRQNERGEIVFLLKRLSAVNLYDIIKIF